MRWINENSPHSVTNEWQNSKIPKKSEKQSDEALQNEIYLLSLCRMISQKGFCDWQHRLTQSHSYQIHHNSRRERDLIMTAVKYILDAVYAALTIPIVWNLPPTRTWLSRGISEWAPFTPYCRILGARAGITYSEDKGTWRCLRQEWVVTESASPFCYL